MSDRAPATEPRSGTTGPGTDAGTTGSGTDAGVDPRAPDAVTVRIPGPLRSLTDGSEEIGLAAGTVEGALEALVARHPGLRRHLLTDDGAVRDYVNLFVDEEDVRYLDGVGTPLRPGQVVTIVPSIAGG